MSPLGTSTSCLTYGIIQKAMLVERGQKQTWVRVRGRRSKEPSRDLLIPSPVSTPRSSFLSVAADFRAATQSLQSPLVTHLEAGCWKTGLYPEFDQIPGLRVAAGWYHGRRRFSRFLSSVPGTSRAVYRSLA